MQAKPWLSALLSLLLPGLGQLYNGQTRKAVAFFLFPFAILIFNGLAFAADQRVVFVSAWTVGLLALIFYVVSVTDAFVSARVHSFRVKHKPLVLVGVYVGWWIFSSLFIRIYRANLLESYFVPSVGMEPTLLVGDRFYADKRRGSLAQIQRGDLVLFEEPQRENTLAVKRAVAVQGDRVEVRPTEILVNGSMIASNIHNPLEMDFVVAADHLFVVGDNRDHSYDSRNYGPIPVALLIGKPVQVWFSMDPQNHRVRWDRIGEKL